MGKGRANPTIVSDKATQERIDVTPDGAAWVGGEGLEISTRGFDDDDGSTLLFDAVGDCFLFIAAPRLRAFLALFTATTWGEVRSTVGKEMYEEVLVFSGGGEPTYSSFDHFFSSEFHADPARRESAMQEYVSLSPYTERPAEDNDPFDIQQVREECEYNWPFPSRDMFEWVPDDIVEAFGVMGTTPNGEQLDLLDPMLTARLDSVPDVGDAPDYDYDAELQDSPLLVAFRGHGYHCKRSSVVLLVSGY